MELRDLRFFCVAAKTEHISKAAEQLGVSQPFLTKVIHQIEDELGCELFDHIGRRIRLNQYGDLLLSRAERILGEVEDIHSAFESILDDPDRPLRLITGSSAYCSDLPLKYKEAYPRSSVSRDYMERSAMIKALEDNAADFSLCSPGISDKESAKIISRVLHRERACLIMKAGHPLSKKDFVSLSDLNGLPLITTLKGSDTRNNIDMLCAANNIRPSIVYESIDNSLILRMVADGVGCTVFAWNYSVMLPPSDKYVIREFSDQTGEICLCHNQNLQYTRAHQRFEAFVADYFEALK